MWKCNEMDHFRWIGSVQQGIKDVEALPPARDVVFGGGRRWNDLQRNLDRCINVQLYIPQEYGVWSHSILMRCGRKKTLGFLQVCEDHEELKAICGRSYELANEAESGADINPI